MTYSRKRERVTLEIDNPSATCGHCRFMTELSGKWSVEDGRLVFRAAADPQPRRGPDLESCCESDTVIEFERITVDGEDLTAEQIANLRATAARVDAPHVRIPYGDCEFEPGEIAGVNAADAESPLAIGTPVLLISDYGDTWPGFVEELREVAHQPGRWWAGIRQDPAS